VTDGKGQTRTLSYDKLDRIKFVACGDGSSTTNTWDSNGNLRQRDDFAGGVTSSTVYAYDALNRLKREDFPDGAWNSYQYDLVGNLASLADTSGSVVYAYDRANRLKTVREPGGDCATTPGVGCTRLVYTDNEPDDGAGSSRVTTTLPNGVVIRRTSDAAGRMKRVSARDSSGQLLKSFDYTYTEAGVETMLVQQATNNANETTSYDYGARNRLTDVQVRDSSQALLEHYEYQYDAMANITERRINGNPTSYSFNGANQLCWRFSGATSNGCSNPPAGSVGYQWDDNGNELGNDAGLILGYNAKDQTVRHKDEDATSPVDVTFLGYNQLERIRAGAVTFQNNVLGIGRRTDTTGQAVYFTRTEDGRLIGARPSGSGKYYYVTDGFGSVVALTNASGQIVRHYKYDPYGNLTLNSPSSGAPIDFFRFRGVYNGSAGHYQFGHRLFDPRTGRWTQQDPIDTGGSLKEGNRYSYVGGDPVNRVDSIGTGIGSVVSGVSDAVGDLGDDIDAGIDRFGNLTFDEGVIAASTSIFGGAVCDAALPLAATGPWGVVGAASVCAAGAAGTIYTTWQAGETPGNDLM
jgi:RHS repeat-associated protein